MTSSQEAKLNMYDAVATFLTDNNGIVITIPALTAALAVLSGNITSIRAAAQQEAGVITGITTDKNVLKKTMIDLAVPVAGGVFAFAKSTNDNEMMEKVDYSTSDLMRVKDELAGSVVQIIHDEANANIGTLGTYGITVIMLANLQTAIDDYVAKVPQPRNAVSNRTAIVEQLKTLFKQTDELLKLQMDNLVLQLKATQPNFFNAYTSNRVILDPVTSATKLSGTISDDTSDVVLEGVAVQVEDQPYGTISDPSGAYTLNIPVPGTYNVIYSKSGYTSVTKTNVVITLGNNTVLNVALQPAP